MSICRVEDCGKAVLARGLCTAHYQRMKKHGSVMADVPLQERGVMQWVADHVGYSGDECLIWPFSFCGPEWKKGGGYGQIGVDGRKMGAHRFMCLSAHGEPPEETSQAAHTCGNSRCVNPRHLRWASPVENQRDRLEHGTVLNGEDNPRAKLKEADVLDILALDVSDVETARRYEVSQTLISAIRKGRRWRETYERFIAEGNAVARKRVLEKQKAALEAA